nr:Transposase, Ptta/En/Spm, plant [Ipomoea batatas]
MAPGQSKKRSKFSPSTNEVTTGISLRTNTEVMGSTAFLPRSNLEVNNTQSIDQLNQSMPSTLSPDATPNTDGGLSKKKPCRGPTRGFGLVKRNEVAGKKLQVVVDIEHGRPLNRIESAKLSNELGQIVRDYMPCPIKYSNYTKEEKNCAWERLLMRLDIVNFREDPRVFQCVENILKVRYRNYKHALHKEFLKYHSATEAKLHVPKGLTTENWNELCDYWSKGDVQVKCMINSWCRSQQKMPHNQGSAAFVPVFNELRQKEEGCFMPNRIALFKFTRCKNDKWITNEAEENYKKMVAMLETSELEGNPMTADQVYDAVMGKRLGYVKGMGNGPKLVTSTSTRANNTHLEEKMKATMEENTQLKNEVQELKMKFERYEKTLSEPRCDFMF